MTPLRASAASKAGFALLCTTLILAATGCAGGEEPAATGPSSTTSTSRPANVYEQQRQDGVQSLLDRLGKVLTSDDRGALDALIDPLAADEFRQRLYRAQDALRPQPRVTATRTTAATATDSPRRTESPARRSGRSSVAPTSSAEPAEPPARGRNLVLRTLSYRIGSQDGPERRIGGELEVRLSEAGSSDSWVIPVQLTYALGGTAAPGIDEPVIVIDEALAFSRYGDDWLLLGDGSPAPDPAVDPDDPVPAPLLPPWTYAGLLADEVSTAGGSSVILSYPGTETTVESIRGRLGPAVTAVSDFWGKDWAQRAVVTATDSAEQFAGLTRTAPGETAAAAAATVYASFDQGKRTVVGQRIVLSPTVRTLSPEGLSVVLRHELTHVATRLDTAADAPMWLTEGLAEYVGRRGYRDFAAVAPDLAAAVRAGELPAGLPTDADFRVDTAEATLAYQSAWSFAAFVADVYGEPKLRAMYLATARGDGAAASRSLNATLGKDQPELEIQWRSWLREQVD